MERTLLSATVGAKTNCKEGYIKIIAEQGKFKDSGQECPLYMVSCGIIGPDA